MTDDARAFLQGALMAAVDGSYAMGFVKIIFDNAYMKLPPTDAKELMKLVRDVTRAVFRRLYKHMRETDPTSAPLYKIVVGAINYDCSAYFQSIRQGLL